jgi:hypothetical protein
MGVIAATIVLLAFIVVGTAPYIVIGRAIQHNRTQRQFVAPRVNISELYPFLGTGDILLFRTFNPLSHRYLCRTVFEHAAVLVREGELINTSEMEPAGIAIMPDPDNPGTYINMASGINAVPLLTRIKYFNGVTYAMRLSRALDPGRACALKAATRKVYAYPTLRCAVAEMALDARCGTRHCFQHIAHVLDAGGLTPLGREGTPLANSGFIEVCRDICNLTGLPLPDGYYYEHPVEIVYDIGMPQPGHAESH